MKRFVICIIFVIIFISSGVFLNGEFNQIREENEPYLSQKSQMIQLFNDHKDTFQKIADGLQNEKLLNYQYNSNYKIEGIYNVFTQVYKHNDIISDIIFAIDKLGMTNIDKIGDVLCIYQYKPIIYSDVFIGMKYAYRENQWKFYYHHEFSSCTHKNKVIYKLYDIFYNTF